MPIPLSGAPDVDLDALDSWSASAPVTQGLRGAVIAGQAAGASISHTLDILHGGSPFGQALKDYDATMADDVTLDARDLQRPPTLDSETANQRYGVPGYLRFNGPVSEDDAAWRQSAAYEKQFRDQVYAHSAPSPLTDFGAGLLGGLVDPLNISLAAATGGLGKATLGAFGLGEAADGAAAITRVGRLATTFQGLPRTLAIGAIDNAPLIAGQAALSNAAGDDYDLGDGLRDLVVGAVLHTTVHASLRATGDLLNGVNPEGLRAAQSLAEARAQLAQLRGESAPGGPENGPGVDFMGRPQATPPFADAAAARPDLRGTSSLTPYVPAAVDALPPAARYGAWALALERAINDEPVDVGELIAREQAPPALGRLDEASALRDVASFRPGEAATAVTTRGTEIPVRYGLAELGDLVTSHTDDLQTNSAYPAELQPRQRSRAGAMARNLQLEAQLNPKLLMGDVGAGQGAPIVSPDGVVESGNGRTIALRRAAAKGAPAYDRYKAELAAAGYDAASMRQPVLVRMRTEPLTGSQRAALAHEMNADVTERMSAPEQAMSDAQRMPANIFDAVEEGRSPTTSRAFTRAFIAQVAPDQVASFTDREGRLSPDGARRIKAAVLARAYGDQGLVGQMFEGEETPARRLGEALADAAPAWARLRQLAAGGEIPRLLDLTPALTSAMDLVRHAAREGIKLGELVEDRLGQAELFGGESISPFTEAFLRLFYRDAGFARPLAAEKIAGALKDYARQAAEVKPGPDLFGDTPDETTARGILRIAAEKYAAGDAGNLDVRAPGKSDGGAEPARPLVVDVRAPEPGRAEPGDQGLPGEGEPGAGDAAGPDAANDRAIRPRFAERNQFSDTATGDLAAGFDVPETQGEQLAFDEITELQAARIRALSDEAKEALIADRLDQLSRAGVQVEQLADDFRIARWDGKEWQPAGAGSDLDPALRRQIEELLAAEWNKAGGRTLPLEEFNRRAAEAWDGHSFEIKAPPAAAAKPKVTGQSIIAGDPELKAIAADTERFAAANGLALDTPDNENPDTIAEALRAAAVCLVGELG